MAPFGKIHSYPGNFRVDRAQLVAALNGLEVPLVEDFKMGESNKTPEFLSKFPLGKVPAFEGADGVCIAETVAICTYIARSGPKAAQLLGSDDPKVEAKILEWTCFADNELVPHILAPALMLIFKIYPFDQQKYDTSIAALSRALKRLEVGLQGGRKFLVGDAITMADVMVMAPLFWGLKYFVDAAMRKDFPNVVAYMQGVAKIDEVKKAFGELEMCETAVKP
ncbi:Uu.00g012900.m01.CDS01 [Anthostomella pinea]|uniref:Uu.00g012900.m01.CDS01 n=1 Tax=Anthostomella pinea TaxID=933095 RepID=A0AAI8VY12_9PEZI|nr:Uu.00g012900.m01.CDS01 [Anthostomella pinea]